MSGAVSIRIENLDALQRNFGQAPARALTYLAKATAASLFEIEKQAVDRNFQFRTPRAKRTGFLQRSFDFGRYVAPGGLSASIGPTMPYAPFVYYGTRRGIRPNPYMDRIAKAAVPGVTRQFQDAIDAFTAELAAV
jgi:hypothetical protein